MIVINNTFLIISEKMAWFNFLKSEGYFDPDKNPEPIQVKEGFQIITWEVLGYLEKLSIQISEGKETELIDELLDVIKNVSEHPKDNYRTWYIFIKILTNIPNDRIPKEIFQFIPVWLSGNFDTMLQTSELCDKLLPKFLNGEPTQSDIEKAEIILDHIFQIEKVNTKGSNSHNKGNSYRSKLYLHFLDDKFEKRNLIPKIAKYCSSDFILNLGRTIKFLFLDHIGVINIFLENGENKYKTQIRFENENLSISLNLEDDEIKSHIFLDWEDKSNVELKQELTSFFNQQNILYEPSDEKNDMVTKLNSVLNENLNFYIDTADLDYQLYKGEKLLNTFYSIFKNLLNEKIKQDHEEGLSILKTICFEPKYRISLYKFISIDVISENWDTTKSLFFELIKDNDSYCLFSYQIYYSKIYKLLKKNGKSFTNEEIKIIESIIERGEQVKIKEQRKNEYWKLRWYAALKDIEPFKEKYLSLSELLGITHEYYDNEGKISWHSGSISPITVDDLLKKSNQEIADYIRTFNPKDSFDEPNIEGLSNVFKNAVLKEPEKFINEIDLYQEIPYTYSYYIIDAFSMVWKEQKKLDWEKVLQYCLVTLKNPKFYTGELNIENNYLHGEPNWVISSIACLLTEGLQNDEHAFDVKLLPVVKEIVQIIVGNLKRIEDIEKTNMDYPTYTVNSTAGKSLRALFDYSLHRARNFFKQEDKEKWETDIKSLFEETLQRGIIDAYILEGMYFEQFCFLDYDWITEQVKKYYTSEDREWLAFMRGFVFGNPPYNKELYTILYPHYEKAIDNNSILKTFNNEGLVKHLTAFYFWKYESLSSKKLLFRFLSQAPPEEVGDLIHFISQQKHYAKTLKQIEKQEFQDIIIELWEFLVNKYESSSIEKEQKNLVILTNWIVFAPELNETYKNLIIKSCQYVGKFHSLFTLLDNLVILKSIGNLKMNAKFIGEILLLLSSKTNMMYIDEELIKELVSFLFAHEQKQIAAELCNTMAVVHQQFFLREIYEANR
ncbi:MAG: hypothetical protein EAZ55_00880 [Cytophagales bacterium]|nr:MAG: hypothetical protein EAZ55_00880 [Cytophagales bacterium]